MPKTATTRGTYLMLFATTTDAIEHENSVLDRDRSTLPPCVISVIDGGDITAEYWRYLASQKAD